MLLYVIKADASDGSSAGPDAVERRQLAGHSTDVPVALAWSAVIQTPGAGQAETGQAAGHGRARRDQ